MKTKLVISIIIGVMIISSTSGYLLYQDHLCNSSSGYLHNPRMHSIWDCLQFLSDQESNTPGMPGNFTLTVSNQSFDIDPVDILVKIDGITVIDDEFLVKQQHNYHRFEFILKPGIHTIFAESIKGKYQFNEEFTIEKELWASLSFLYSEGQETPPELRLIISETMIGFL
jgi:hypothetical protein